jgi:hypothetical protein
MVSSKVACPNSNLCRYAEMSDLMRETRMGVTEMRTMMRMNKEMLRRMGEMAELQKSLHHELAALQSSIMLGGSIP